MEGSTLDLYIATEAEAPMQRVELITAWAGKGLADDRYALGTGTYSGKRNIARDVSFIAMEAVRDVNEHRKDGEKFSFADTRRNIITTGLVLVELIGKQFYVGPALMLGIEECTPCVRPSKLSGKNGFAKAFAGRGGLRAEVLSDGIISIGARIHAA